MHISIYIFPLFFSYLSANSIIKLFFILLPPKEPGFPPVTHVVSFLPDIISPRYHCIFKAHLHL